MTYGITPELDVENIDPLKLYVDVLGFKVLYSRPEEKFAYLELEHNPALCESPLIQSGRIML